MPVRKIIYRTDDGTKFIGWVITYENKYWLVPEWREGLAKGTSSPARIICLDGLPLGKRTNLIFRKRQPNRLWKSLAAMPR
jgi:hypothetical protein